MFIKKIAIKNFRLFKSENILSIEDFNIPDGNNEGSGLTIFVGENGCGKTSLLDAIALPLLEYKIDNFSIDDIFDPKEKVDIKIYSQNNFTVTKTMPNGSFEANGFSFEGGIRSRGNKAYLSSMVVSDQKYLSIDPDSPKESSPDLRVSVNNPFRGKRFDENDILYLDKNRLFQIRSGTYNRTRFDRLMEDFSLQYLKSGSIEKINEALDQSIKNKVENTFLANAVQKFEEITNLKISLDLINNYQPLKDGFFAIRKENGQQIHINMLGSGFEMFFSFLYSFYLAQQSQKQLIILIDEAELHLHQSLQEDFVRVILEFSKQAQIILTTHSPLLVKQIAMSEIINIKILGKDDEGKLEVSKMNSKVLPYVSANEINFLAFNLPTEEYHNELYEELKFLKGEDKNLKDFDSEFFISEKGESKNSPWMGNPNEVSSHTFIRNQIHHQKDNGKPEFANLKTSIIKMREFLGEIINQ